MDIKEKFLDTLKESGPSSMEMFDVLQDAVQRDTEIAQEEGWSSKTVNALKGITKDLKSIAAKVKKAEVDKNTMNEIGLLMTKMLDEFWEDESDYGPTLTLYKQALKMYQKIAK